MKKKETSTDISVKSTKEQILAAYHQVLDQLNEKQVASPEEQKKKEEEKAVLNKVNSSSSESIITDLASLKSKAIKQIDAISEELLTEFEKLTNLKEAINLEQNHLQDLYQINE